MRLVRDVMQPNPPKAPPDATVACATLLLRQHGCDALAVVDGEKFLGMVDVLSLTLFSPEALVVEVLGTPAVTLSPETTAAEAAARMRSERAWHAPVLEQERLVGVLSARDLLPGGVERIARTEATPPAAAPARSNGHHKPEGTVLVGSALRSGVMLDDCRIQSNGKGVEVLVRLKRGGQQHERRGVAPEAELVRTLASATAKCLEPFIGSPVDVQVEETYEYTSPLGLPCVGATLTVTAEDGGTRRLVGVVPMNGSFHEAYIHAVLDAANRWLLE
jgi:hypothetical protein